MVLRQNLPAEDMEFVQFHPTGECSTFVTKLWFEIVFYCCR